MADDDHYAVLGISHSADYASIRSAYNRLVIKNHPDKGGSNEAFIKIQQAFEALREPVSRAEYDKKNKIRSFRRNEEETGNKPQAAKGQSTKPPFSPTAAPFKPSAPWPRSPRPPSTQSATNESSYDPAWTQYRDAADKPKSRPRRKPKSAAEPEPIKRGRRGSASFQKESTPTTTDPKPTAARADDVHPFPPGTPSSFRGAPVRPTRPGSQEPNGPSATSQANQPPTNPVPASSEPSPTSTLALAQSSADRIKRMVLALDNGVGHYISPELWCHLQHFQMRLVNQASELQLRQATEFNCQLQNRLNPISLELPAWDSVYYAKWAMEDKEVLDRLGQVFLLLTETADALSRRKHRGQEDNQGIHNMNVDDDEICRRLEDVIGDTLHDLKTFLIEVLFVGPSGQGDAKERS
ncbi:hypothetical protein EDD37DRAFT_203488 [Exophiala viscosa]|uniref:uncharacterized protein n=1 Tax=Exophiala viscosa TaxID=2486360 RepID=UPI00219AB2C5|nr:hypothetical protein EDD37DRAFT_203488 [Exophiala viscosa]